jgi:hypothetical protein
MTMDDKERQWQADVKRLRANLRRSVTLAKKKKTKEGWQNVFSKAIEGMHYFDQNGYPDYWHEFERAGEDASMEVRRLESSWR